MKNDLSKKDLYESVKILVEADHYPHIHLTQHKLFTLFSVAFQYLLFMSTKKHGAYIIRIEDSSLAEKLLKKSKDTSTRRFLQALLLPRKLQCGRSCFYLDFFNINTWKMTSEIPREKVKAALIIKNSSIKPMIDLLDNDTEEETNPENDFLLQSLKDNFFLTSLSDFVPKTITIAYGHSFEGLECISFPIIEDKEEKALSGVKISKSIKFEHP